MIENIGTDGGEVVLFISGEEKALENKVSRVSSKNFTLKDSEALTQQRESQDSRVGFSDFDKIKSKVQMSTFMSSPSPEKSKFSCSLHKPSKRRFSLRRSTLSKPKSRFLEPSGPLDEDHNQSVQKDRASNWPYSTSPCNKSSANNTPRESTRTAPITPKTPSVASSDDDEEIYKSEKVKTALEKSHKKRFKVMVWVEWAALVCIMGFLIASFTVNKFQKWMIWGLEFWKWCVLVLVIVCGRLATEWFMKFLVFLIERNFLFKKKVLYFIHGLKRSVQNCIWLGLVALAWELLFKLGAKRSQNATKILNYLSRALACFLVGALIWLVKTLLVKILASSFHVNTFFDRIQESIFHQYVLQTLSGPPLMELAERVGSTKNTLQMNFRNKKKGNEEEKQDVIDVGKLQKIKQGKVSAWTMKGLINVIMTSGLSTILKTIDQDGEGYEHIDKEITNEWEAKAASHQIFINVAGDGFKYIDKEDLLRFLNEEEVDNLLPLFEGTRETGKIKKKALKNWVVKVYLERKSLAHSLNDTKTAVKQLNRLLTGAMSIVICIVWLLIMGFATIRVFVLLSSQMILIGFMFGNTAKTIFESIILVFVMHPFDVGDRCVIDGVEMMVEEMNILTTVFLRYDNEKIYYPNSVLTTKPISNYYRSPDMGDAIEFSVDVSTSMEIIGALKARIKTYIESKPHHWHAGHDVLVKDIINGNKMEMGLYFTHTMNYQNMGEKGSRRSDLVIELKKIFEELSIRYHLLPQEVHLRSIG